MAGFRAAPVYIVADGQSLNTVPTLTPTWVERMCTDYGYVTPYVPAIGGAPWYFLSTHMELRTAYAHAGLTTVYTMLGGEADMGPVPASNYPGWGLASGATTYTRMTDMADQCRTAGYDLMIGCTIPPVALWTAPQEAQRVIYNDLIIANGDDTFDAIIDFTVTPLEDNTDETYYFVDHTHWNSTGAQLAADIIGPVVDGLL